MSKKRWSQPQCILLLTNEDVNIEQGDDGTSLNQYLLQCQWFCMPVQVLVHKHLNIFNPFVIKPLTFRLRLFSIAQPTDYQSLIVGMKVNKGR